MVCFAPPLFLPVYVCTHVGPWGLLAFALPAPFLPQSAKSLGPALPVYLHAANVGPWGLLAFALRALFIKQSSSLWVLSGIASPLCQGCLSAPLLLVWMNVSFLSPWLSDLMCGSIFCQFWLFFVFKLLLSFFWLCEEVQCVYLRLYLGFPFVVIS